MAVLFIKMQANILIWENGREGGMKDPMGVCPKGKLVHLFFKPFPYFNRVPPSYFECCNCFLLLFTWDRQRVQFENIPDISEHGN